MRAPTTTVALLVASLLLVNCVDPSTPVSPLPPSPPSVVTMSANPAGEGQEGVAGYPLPLPIRVEVRRDGVAVPGVVVHWEAVGGSVSPVTGVTDANGIASAEWTLGPDAGLVTASARITEPAAKTVTFSATAIEEVDATPVPSTQFQSAEVGATLPQPIQVRVTKNGLPRAGVPVSWRVIGGSITETTLTGPDGIASAIWTMPSTPGVGVARATVRGNRSGPWTFQGTALIGPPAQIVMLEGNAQALPPYADIFRPLTVSVRDRFGNAIRGVGVDWVVEQGPVVLLDHEELTGAGGRSSATATAGAAGGGNGVVKARVGSDLIATFALTIEPPVDAVFLDTYRSIFVSGRNRTAPAVDTVAVGTTVTWRLSVFDYDLHAVASVGTPALPGGGEFPYASPSTVQIRFTAPGTYRYIDPYTGATGTMVVQ